MPRQTSKKKSAGKRKKKKRPYAVTKLRHARRRHARSGRHHGRMLREAVALRHLMTHMLKKQHKKDYHYDPRHYSNDPEYKYSDDATKAFKRDVPTVDTDFWRPQAPRGVPYAANFRHARQHVRPQRHHPYPWHWHAPAGAEIYDHLR